MFTSILWLEQIKSEFNNNNKNNKILINTLYKNIILFHANFLTFLFFFNLNDTLSFRKFHNKVISNQWNSEVSPLKLEGLYHILLIFSICKMFIIHLCLRTVEACITVSVSENDLMELVISSHNSEPWNGIQIQTQESLSRSH